MPLSSPLCLPPPIPASETPPFPVRRPPLSDFYTSLFHPDIHSRWRQDVMFQARSGPSRLFPPLSKFRCVFFPPFRHFLLLVFFGFLMPIFVINFISGILRPTLKIFIPLPGSSPVALPLFNQVSLFFSFFFCSIILFREHPPPLFFPPSRHYPARCKFLPLMSL